MEKNDPVAESLSCVFITRRVAVIIGIGLFSMIMPSIEVVLSLVCGSICGSILLILPTLFYRKAYIERPSRKPRTRELYLGYSICVLAIIVGLMGVAQNLKEILGGDKEE